MTDESNTGIGASAVIRSYCAQCYSFCGAKYHISDGRLVKVTPDKEHPNGHGICIRGAAVPELVHSPHRLLYPMKRTHPKGDRDPGWVRISWDEAMDTIAQKLSEIKENYGPEAVFFNRGAPAGTGAGDYSDWVTRFAHCFGSPNAGATTHICQWHRDGGSKYTYGYAFPYAFPEPDYDNTRCVLLWGHNPHVTNHAQQVFIQRALERGAKLIVVDPRPIPFTSKADVWLRIRPGTDGALALAMIKAMLDEKLYDEAFVREWTNSTFLVRSDTGRFLRESDVSGGSSSSLVLWDASSNSPRYYDPTTASTTPDLGAAMSGEYVVVLADDRSVACKPAFQLLGELVTNFTPEKMERVTWCKPEDVRQAVRLLRESGPACYMSFNGIEQHSNATQTNRALCTLYSMTGWLDSQGGNISFNKTPVNPVVKPGLISREQFGKILGIHKRPLGPASMGAVQTYEAWEAILTGKPYPIEACVAFGGNQLMANGNSILGREALQKLDFFVQVDFFLTPSAQLADIVLPAATQWETPHVRTSFWLGTSTASYCQLRQQVLPPPGDCRSDMQIMFDLASRLGFGAYFGHGDIEAAFDQHLEPAGITIDDLKLKPGGIHIPVPQKYKKYSERDPQTGAFLGFTTPTRRVEIYSEVFLDKGYDPLPVYCEPAVGPISRPDLAEKYPLILTNGKVAQFNHSQHRSLPSLRKHAPHPYVEVNPHTAKELGIENGDWVYLETISGRVKMTAKYEPKIDPRVICTQHGWWQPCPELGLPGYDVYSPEGANVNLLVTNDVIDPISGSVPHRSYLCNIRKAGPDPV